MSPVHDLHCHSTASDGTLSPTELVQRAAAHGVQVLALTDHDTTEGVDEALIAAANLPIKVWPGVEISVSWGGATVHMVGLRVDPREPSLQQGLERLRTFRVWRAEEIGRRLHKSGIEGAWVGANRLANGGLISRTHFARFLVEQGHARNVSAVFSHFLKRGKPGYVAGEWAGLGEAIDWIHAAGGRTVVAHPARYAMSRGKLRSLLREFQDLGGDALEVVSGSHSPDDERQMAALAGEFGLLASCGSDFHDPRHTWVELGRMSALPQSLTPVWHDWH